jgi:hypothetical protein
MRKADAANLHYFQQKNFTNNNKNSFQMKRFTLLTLILLGLFFSREVQSQNSFNYQAVLRQSGDVVTNKAVTLRVSLLQGTPTAVNVYSEQHAVNTGPVGIVNLHVGEGTVLSGTFDAVNWSAGEVTIRIEADLNDGQGYLLMGESPVLAVPVALYAQEGTPGPKGDKGDQGLQGATGATGPPGPSGTSSWTDGTGIVTTTKKVGIGTGNPTSMLSVQADASLNADTALFQVKDNQGRTVFAVYDNGAVLYVKDDAPKGGRGGFVVSGRTTSKENVAGDILLITPDSVRIYVDDAASKGGRGGFAVSGRTPTKGVNYDYMYISPDSARIYINESAGKGGRGGFAVGGRTPAKGVLSDYLTINTDSVRVYVADNAAKGGRGGFAVSGRTPAKGMGKYLFMLNYDSTRFVTRDSLKGFGVETMDQAGQKKFMDISALNTFIGHQSGSKNIPNRPAIQGVWNSFIGYQAGAQNTTGYSNVYMGYQAGTASSTSFHNVFIGDRAGFTTTGGNKNTFLGYQSGYKATSGSNNVAVGSQAGYTNTTGLYNVYVGCNSGYLTAGNTSVSGTGNTMVGYNSGLTNNGTGKWNTFLGYNAGNSSGAASRCVFIGANAGYSEKNANKLYIANTNEDSTKVLVFGDFAAKKIVFNGNVGVRVVSPSCGLELPNLTTSDGEGKANKWTALSDARIKTNITEIQYGLDEILRLNPVSYEMHSSTFSDGKLILSEDTRHSIGLIAQELSRIIPEVAEKPLDESQNLWAVDYDHLIPVLVKALQEEHQLVLDQNAQIERLQQSLMELNKKVNELDNKLSK